MRPTPNLSAQEKLTVSYSSIDAPSANWYIAQEKGLYKKHGLDVESIFIPASSTNVAVLVAGQLKFGNGTGGTIASAAVSGANLVAVACFMNTLPYELIVQDSIKSKEQLKGKSMGISRIGSSSDVIARVFLRYLGLEPDKDVAMIQVGGGGVARRCFPHRPHRRLPRASPESCISRKACRSGSCSAPPRSGRGVFAVSRRTEIGKGMGGVRIGVEFMQLAKTGHLGVELAHVRR